jgi:hypothetical protein
MTKPRIGSCYDRVEYKYNRQAQQIEVKDQNETFHDYLFDNLGRQTEDCVTSFGTGVDDTVKRIERTYEVRGMVASTKSYDNASLGYGNVLNEVLDQYNEWGLLDKEYQAHAGPVNTGSTPYVQYGDGKGGRKRGHLWQGRPQINSDLQRICPPSLFDHETAKSRRCEIRAEKRCLSCFRTFELSWQKPPDPAQLELIARQLSQNAAASFTLASCRSCKSHLVGLPPAAKMRSRGCIVHR